MKTIFQLLVTLLSTTLLIAYAEVININTADSHLIAQKLKGIGTIKANAIVEYREKHGDFTQIDELLNVTGIGDKTLEQIKDQIIFNEATNKDDLP